VGSAAPEETAVLTAEGLGKLRVRDMCPYCRIRWDTVWCTV
jgi:hypothetical protein